MKELWDLIDEYTSLNGFKVSFERLGYNNNLISLERGDQKESCSFPDDHMPGSIPEALEYMKGKFLPKKGEPKEQEDD